MSAWDDHDRKKDNHEFDEMLRFIVAKVPELTKEFLRTLSESLSDTTTLRNYSEAIAKAAQIQLEAYIKAGFSREEALQMIRGAFNLK